MESSKGLYLFGEVSWDFCALLMNTEAPQDVVTGIIHCRIVDFTFIKERGKTEYISPQMVVIGKFVEALVGVLDLCVNSCHQPAQ